MAGAGPPSTICLLATAKSWIPAFVGMTGVVAPPRSRSFGRLLSEADPLERPHHLIRQRIVEMNRDANLAGEQPDRRGAVRRPRGTSRARLSTG